MEWAIAVNLFFFLKKKKELADSHIHALEPNSSIKGGKFLY